MSKTATEIEIDSKRELLHKHLTEVSKLLLPLVSPHCATDEARLWHYNNNYMYNKIVQELVYALYYKNER